MSLLEKLERRQKVLLEDERLARYERQTVEAALTLLRIRPEDEPVVVARLRLKGVRV